MIAWSEIGFSVAAGGLTTLSPCVFPLLPLVLGGAVQKNRAAPLAMGVGMILSFAAIGILLGVAGDALGLDAGSVRTGGAYMLLAFGLVMLVPWLNSGFTRLMAPLASSANRASSSLDTRSLWGGVARGWTSGADLEPVFRPLAALAWIDHFDRWRSVAGGASQ